MCDLVGLRATLLWNREPRTTENYQHVSNNQLISKCDSSMSLLTEAIHHSGSPRAQCAPEYDARKFLIEQGVNLLTPCYRNFLEKLAGQETLLFYGTWTMVTLFSI
jgi:hypothetical protein